MSEFPYSPESRHPGKTIKIPVPPSVNNSYKPGKARKGNYTVFKSKNYTGWKKQAVAIILSKYKEDQLPELGKNQSKITISAAILHNRDLDNILKGTFDALTSARKIEDDRWVSEISAIRVPTGWGSLGKGEMLVSIDTMLAETTETDKS